MYNHFKCCLCDKKFVGYGNNPYPITNQGVCCDACNYLKVIPARMLMHQLAEKEDKKDE